jgi:hypothetical protein
MLLFLEFSYNFIKSSLHFAQKKSRTVRTEETAVVYLRDYVICLNSLPAVNAEAERGTSPPLLLHGKCTYFEAPLWRGCVLQWS